MIHSDIILVYKKRYNERRGGGNESVQKLEYR